jgi:hypothetical protein
MKVPSGLLPAPSEKPEKVHSKNSEAESSETTDIGRVIVQLEAATLNTCKLVPSTGAWQLVFEIPSTEREKIPLVTAEHQLAFILTLSRKKRKKLRKIAEVTG